MELLGLIFAFVETMTQRATFAPSSYAPKTRTLARILCSGEELNAIARQLNFCSISIIMIKSKFTASNTFLNSAEYAIIRKEHFSFLA